MTAWYLAASPSSGVCHDMTPGSTKWRFVRRNADTPTDAMTEWIKVGLVHSKLSGATSFLRILAATYTLSFCVSLGAATVNIFHPWTIWSVSWKTGIASARGGNVQVVVACWQRWARARDVSSVLQLQLLNDCTARRYWNPDLAWNLPLCTVGLWSSFLTQRKFFNFFNHT